MEDARLEEIARRHGIRLLLQFGSTVSGRTHARSDVDLAALLDRATLSLSEHAALLHDLQSLNPDREVDLVLINHADPLLLKKIMEAPRLLYGTARQVQELRIYAFKRHQDHRRYFDLERRFVARIASSTTASMIDRELIIRKLALITGDLAELKAVAQRPRDEYLASVRDELVAERLLERMIGRMIDVNYHPIVERGNPPPTDYYESFVRLGTLKVLPPDFARRLAPCAGLRDRVVHEYEDIDAARVYEALQAAVKDIPEYVRYIQQHVEASGST